MEELEVAGFTISILNGGLFVPALTIEVSEEIKSKEDIEKGINSLKDLCRNAPITLHLADQCLVINDPHAIIKIETDYK